MPESEPDALVAAVLHQQPLHKLLRAGADPTVRDQAGLTPLHHAVLAGNVDAVEALLDHACKRTRPLRKAGGEPSRAPGSPWDLATAPGPPPSRASPLHLAAERSDSLLRLILGHSSLTSVGASFLGIPISSRPQTELLHLRDARGWSLLHYAVSRANLSAIRQLLPHMGANASELGSSSSSRSSSAGGAPPHNLHHHATYGINVPDALGRTALHQAALLGHADCCRLLLKAGADQSLPSAQLEVALPLHLAASGNHTAVVEVLFRHAVNQSGFRAAQAVLLRPNAAGLTALHVAVQHGAVDAARRLLHLVFPFDTRGPLGRTALHIAALLGDTAMISMLLGHSTPQQHQLTDAEGFTAMHLAAATGHLEALRVLAAGGCGVDVRAVAAPHAPSGCEGWTPLHCAVRQGDVAAIELLVSELGADPHAKDDGGRTPYDLAVAVAGDDSRSGSSVVGGGSGIHNLDDAQWGTDATGTESEEGALGRSGSSPQRAGSNTIRGGSSATAVTMVVDPLQGPSGFFQGIHGLNVFTGGGGGVSTRLDESQALAVLQTFIRLLHEPVRRNNTLQPSLISALGGGASTQSVGSGIPLSGLLNTHQSRVLMTSGTGDFEGETSSPTKLRTAAGSEAAVLPGSSDVPKFASSGLPVTPESAVDRLGGPGPGPSPREGHAIMSGKSRPRSVSATKPAAVASAAAAALTALGKLGDSARGAERALSRSPQLPPHPAAGIKGTPELKVHAPEGVDSRKEALAAVIGKSNGHALVHEQRELRLPNIPRGMPDVSGGEGGGDVGMEVPSVALAYAAQMLAGPAATPTRSSPFTKAVPTRQSPFRKAQIAAHPPAVHSSATATVTATILNSATAARSVDPAAATVDSVSPWPAAATDFPGIAAAHGATAAAPTAAGPEGAANGAVALCIASARSVSTEAAEQAMSAAAGGPAGRGAAAPAANPALTPSVAAMPPKRSPFVTSAKSSPFAVASVAATAAAAAMRRPQPEAADLEVLAHPQQQLLEPSSSAESMTAAPGIANPLVTAAAAAATTAPTPPAATAAATPVVELEVIGNAGASPLTVETLPAAEQDPLSNTPFVTATAPQQAATLFVPIASLCVVSAINSPCGYSALNRAILLQRHALVEALLGTLPAQGHNGGVLVLAASSPVGGGRPSATTVSYQPYNASHVRMTGVLQPQVSPVAEASSSEMPDSGNGPRPITARGVITTRAPTIPTPMTAAAPPSLGPCARAQTPPCQQQSRLQLQFNQITGGVSSSPAASDGPVMSGADASSRIAPPLLPLSCPFGTQAVFAGGVSAGPAVIPGLLHWDETNETFRTQPPNHTSRAWLHWPGEPDPSTGWLVAELEVVEAGAAGGHVWLGLGPPPDVLAAAMSSGNSSGNLAIGVSAAVNAATAAAAMATKASGVGASAMTRSVTTPAGGLVPGGAPSGRTAGGGGGGASAAVPTPVAMCPIINHKSTHVACLRDGQAFRGGVLAADLGAATRLEARNGDTVALFWNRRGRSAAYTLNGRYCGRLSGLPANAQLTPLVGLQCAGFVFKWRCCSRVGSKGASGTPEPYTCATCTSNIDGMLIREQMLHEDPETPWLCKPSMTSLHFAAWSGNVRVLPQLVRAKGFSPDEVDVDGWTPLHFAGLAGQDEAVRLLLSLNCEPDRKSKYGSTPAMLAAKYGRSPEHVAIVRLLSDVGAVLDLRDPRGRTLLMLAARAGNLAMVQLLLERGLDPSATDALDREAQQYAGQHAAIFRLLRSAQAAQRAGTRKVKRQQQQKDEKQKQLQQAAAPTAAAVADVGGICAGAGASAGTPGAFVEGNEEEEEEEEDTEDEEDGKGNSVEVSDSNGTDAEGVGMGRGREVDVQHLPLLAERWRVGAGQLIRGRLIEQGAFGAVFEGTWCGARVAIKQVMRRRLPNAHAMTVGNGVADDSNADEEPEVVREALSLEREVAILAALPPHERIARMLGSVKLPGEGMCLVMAYYPHTLQSVMQSERLRRSWLTPSRRAAIARQLAEGLGFLHGLPGPRVIHRDLKPNNVLLEAAPSLGVKICDFGLSRILAGNDVQSSSAAGHAFWMAPELLRAQPYDEKVDVYSYGVILYQLAYWVDDQLYGGLNKAQVDFQVVHGILRLQDRLPGGIDAGVQALVRDCVDENPRNRPSMVQVLERLSNVRDLPQPGHGHAMVTHPPAPAIGIPGEVATKPTVAGLAALVVDPEHHRQG